MINIEQFKDFQVAFGALRSGTVDVAIIEIREEDRAEDVACHVIVGNDDFAREIKKLLPYYFKVNDYSGFPTFLVFKDADAIQAELS